MTLSKKRQRTESRGIGSNDCGRAEPVPEPDPELESEHEHTHTNTKKVSNGNFELMNETKRNELNWFHLCAAALSRTELSSELLLPSCPLSAVIVVVIVAVVVLPSLLCSLCRFLALLSWKYFRLERKRLIKPKEFLCNFVCRRHTQHSNWALKTCCRLWHSWAQLFLVEVGSGWMLYVVAESRREAFI